MSFLLAALLLTTPRGVIVADTNRVELHDRGAIVWSAEGVAHPTKLVAGDTKIAVLDALNNEVRTLDLRDGRSTVAKTSDTPVDAEFEGDVLRILERGRDDAAFRKDGMTYYRLTGVLQVGGRNVTVAPFASDLESDGRTAYLVYPREAKVRTVSLRTFEIGEFGVGAVPVDLAISGRMLAVADPAAKRVWMVDGVETMTEAVARGFLRGLLGLGLGGRGNSDFPTGVDRVECRGKRCVAFDSVSGTLYSAGGKVLAKNAAFALTDDGVVLYRDGRLTALRLH